ncbi:MAG: hypothetical protein C4315_04310 [Chloroflexota bacterium]
MQGPGASVKPGRPPGRDLSVAAAIFAFLGAVYLLTFGGRFTSIDEFASYALTESLVQTGRADTPQLEFARVHNPVGRVEPGQALMAVPLYGLAQRLPGVNLIQGVMLLNVMVTALTGAGLFLVARGLGFGPVGSLLAALAFGLGTMAWPYARMFLREPAVGLAWVAALGTFLAWGRSGRATLAVTWVLCLFWATVVKVTAAAAVPAFLVPALLFGPGGKSAGVRRLVFGGLIAFAGAVAVAAWRFGPDGLASFLPDYSPGKLAARTYGQVLSPAKGLLFFSPLTLVAAPGWVGVWGRSRPAALAALGTVLGTLLVYGGYEAWYGGLTWGPRFMVPLLPLLCLPVAALVEGRGPWPKMLVAVGFLLSLPIQLGVVAGAWDRAVLQFDWATDPNLAWYDLRLWYRSPAVYQLTHWAPDQVDFLWWHRLSDGSEVRDLTLGGLIGLGVVTAGGLIWAALRGLKPVLVGAASLGVFGLAAVALLGQSARLTRDFPGLSLAEARGLATRVTGSGQPFTLVTVSNEFYIHYWLGLVKGRFVHHWYSPEQRTGFEAVLAHPESKVIWLVVDRAHLPPGESGRDLELWLNTRAYRFTAGWVGSYEVFGYLPPVGSLPRVQAGYVWENGVELVAFGAETDRVGLGEAFRLEFDFRAVRPVNGDYDWFVHLLAPDGRVILGRHAQPGFGALPTSGWAVGATVTDRAGILVPWDTPPGEYDLIAGFFRPGAGPVPVAGWSGPPAEYAILGKVTVVEGNRG